MASRNFLEEGLDLTGLAGDANNAQILQSIRESVPATDLGWHIKSETTPDVATYPEYVTFLWTKPSTNETKYWNGSSWQLISTAVSISDGSVVIAKLSITGGAATQLIRINAGGTAFEFVDAADIISNNSLALAKLVNAAGAGYVLYSGGGGVWSTSLFTTLFSDTLNASDIPIARLKDVASVGALDQVLRRKTDGTYEHQYADQLLRDGQVSPNTLAFAAGNAGKYLAVGASGTGVQYKSATEIVTGLSVAIVQAQKAANNAAQVITGVTGPTVVSDLVEAVDPGNIVSVASDRMSLTAGTYEFDIEVPLYMASGNVVGQIQLYNYTASAIVAHRNFTVTVDGDYTTARLCYVVTPSVTTEYTVRVETATSPTDLYLGLLANMGGLNEVYTQIKIRKLA